jgi:hypothetical protein
MTDKEEFQEERKKELMLELSLYKIQAAYF